MNYFNKLIFVICLFWSVGLNAQNKDLYNVKLKSGLVIKCELLKVVPDSFIMIKQYDQISKINYSDVLSINFSETTEKYQPPQQQSIRATTVKIMPENVKKNVPDSGLSFGLQTGLCFGQTNINNELPTVSILLRLSILYGITKRFQAGVAGGLDPYLQYHDLVIGSLLGEARYYLVKEKTQSPFFHTQCGYGFKLNSDYAAKEGGLSYLIGIGQSFRDNSQNIFSMMLGYRSQRTKDEVNVSGPSGNFTRTYHREFNRFEFKIECRF